MGSIDWSNLPAHILARVFYHLQTDSRFADVMRAGLVCRHWNQAVRNPEVWRFVDFCIDSTSARTFLENIFEKYAPNFQSVSLLLDQGEARNRETALNLLEKWCSISGSRRKIHDLEICFFGQNPLFYAGQEFVDMLYYVFLTGKFSFRRIDLHRLQVKLTDDLLSVLATNHYRSLTYLDIQNKELICHVTRQCLEQVVHSCRNLRDLRCSHVSVSSCALSELSRDNCDDDGRTRLAHLSLLCRRQDKYDGVDLTEGDWINFKTKNSGVKVTLKFDSTCTLEKMREIMKPVISVHFLFLECYSTPLDIFNAGDFFKETLRKLVVQAKPSDDLDQVLIDLMVACPRLIYLHVMCLVSESTLNCIFGLRPDLLAMVERGKSTLKHTLDPFPWVTEKELDEIPLND